jgi:atypical dual specificity phosphatase
MAKTHSEVRRLNFTWLIESKVAGHAAPQNELDLASLREKGIKTLVMLAESSEGWMNTRIIEKYGFKELYEPVPEMSAPGSQQIERIIDFINESLSEGRPVGVSCEAGLGRTGTILACYLVSMGWNSDAAIREVRLRRPNSIETREQEDAIRTYARKMA